MGKQHQQSSDHNSSTFSTDKLKINPLLKTTDQHFSFLGQDITNKVLISRQCQKSSLTLVLSTTQ